MSIAVTPTIEERVFAPDDIQLILTSHSIDGTFESCPRKFEFTHVWKRQPEGGSSGFAADVGTALHEAVQAWARLALFPGRDRSYDNSTAYQAGLLALLRWWPWGLEVLSLQEGKAGVKQRSLGESILLYERIINHAYWDDWELIDIKGFGPSIEVPYRINHSSLGYVNLPTGKVGLFVTQGKIDFVLRSRRTGEIRVFDIKTTVKDKRAHEAAFKWSGQGPGYGLVIAAALKQDWNVNGFSMTYVVSTFAKADGSEGADVDFITYDYTPEQIQDGIDTKLERLGRMAFYAKRQHWPRRQHGCDSFNQPCAYMGICARRDSDFIDRWFAFENFEEANRMYHPIWELEA